MPSLDDPLKVGDVFIRAVPRSKTFELKFVLWDADLDSLATPKVADDILGSMRVLAAFMDDWAIEGRMAVFDGECFDRLERYHKKHRHVFLD